MEPGIAIVAGELSGGGAERQLHYLLQGLTRAGARIAVASLTPGDPGEALVEALGIPLYRVPRSPLKVDRIPRLVGWLRRERPLIVHSWVFYSNLYASIAGAIAGVPVRIGSVRNAFFEPEGADGHLGLTARWGLELPHALVVNSQNAADALAARGPRGIKLQVIRNGMELPAMQAPAPLSTPVIALVGRLIPVKNVPMFLRVIAHLAGSYPEVEGWLIGDGPEREAIEAQTRAMGLTGRVRFCGWTQDVPALLAQADVLCHCSHSEGLPNALMEASALGLPVVATRVGGAAEVVAEGVTGFLVERDDDRAMAAYVERLLSDTGLHSRMSAAGRCKMEEEFSVERMVGDMSALYRELLVERGLPDALSVLRRV